MVFLKLLSAFFEFDLLQLVVDGLGLGISLCVALEFLELLDPLAVGFHCVLQRLALGGYDDRQVIRTRAALYALDLLRRMALGLPVPDAVPITPETPPEQIDL